MPADEVIEMAAAGEHRYAVTVHSAVGKTVHQVAVPPHLLEALALRPDDEARLVQASFEFLLDREPASSILRRFDLAVIGRYFPEYMETMRRRLTCGGP